MPLPYMVIASMVVPYTDDYQGMITMPWGDAVHNPYVDRYKDGSEAFGFNVPFQGGTHGMIAASAVIIPAKPIAVLSLYCLFRLR